MAETLYTTRTDTRATRLPDDRRRALGGGAIAGIVGGIALTIALLFGAWMTGASGWVILKFASLPFLSDARVFQPGFEAGPVLLGVTLHFLVSVGWGVLFALFFYGLSRGGTVLAGLLWGVVVWLAMYYAVMPLLGLGAIARGAPVWPALINHLIFGLFVGLGFLPFQRRIVRRARVGGARGTQEQTVVP
jgi:hypothetical protein